VIAKLWWIVHKDLLSECRARRVWPAMLLLGVVVALVVSIQMDLPVEQKPRMVGSMLWLAIFFAGMMCLDRSLALEHEDGCWDAMRLYPVSPAMIYLAKLAVNLVCLAALAAFLLPLFVVLSDVPLLDHPLAMLLIAGLGSVGFAAVGTLASALVAGLRQAGNLLAILVLPLVIPLLLAAAEATELTVAGDFGSAWWRWIQLLGCFAVIFTVAGAVLFEFVVED